MTAFKTSVVTFLAAYSLLLSSPKASAWQAKIADGWASVVAVDGAGNVVAAGATDNAATGTDFTVAKFDGASGQELWRQVITGSADDWANALAVDNFGNVVAAGYTCSATDCDFTVIKFDGATGVELWRKLIADGRANAVVVDAAANVVAAGQTSFDFTVVKFDGVSGAVLWRKDIQGTDGYYNWANWANAVAVDAAGDVVAAGATGNAETGSDFTVVKLSGANGAELWRQIIYGTDYYFCYDDYFCSEAANAIAVDPADNVLVAGAISNLKTGLDFTVAKLDGMTGAVLWRKETDGGASLGDGAVALAVDAAGNVVAVGSGFKVIKYSGVNGAELWRRIIDGGNYASAVTVDATGEVVAAGNGDYNTGTFSDFTVIKFSGVNGNELWRQVINGTTNDYDWAGAVAVDAAGRVVAAGRIGHDFAVVKLTGPLFLGPTTSARGEAGLYFTSHLPISGGVPPYVVSITRGKLPAGLSLSNDGFISGIISPTAKSETITVRITDDSVNNSVSKTFRLTVLKPPQIAAKGRIGRVGKYYAASVRIREGLGPFKWFISAGALPMGLSFNTATGAITGIPTQGGTFPLTVQVTDALGGVDTANLTLTIR